MHAMASTLKGSLNWSKPSASLEGAPDEAEIKKAHCRDRGVH